ncbi:MAG: D-serine ammonia-lyase [Spirochaetia bacterium]|jgi:D-serine dehydratase|nr:D-serine ammonia-lyase [Spirochaetia bacterium]
MNAFELIKNKKPLLWINPDKLNSEKALSTKTLTTSDIKEAEERLQRFAPLLIKIFPELQSTGGVIDSELMELGLSENTFIKSDHSLSISGSIKARGGFYAVFVIVEKILSEHGLSVTNITNKTVKDIRSLFASRSLVVGSTGNLGLSIGLMGRAFGFSVTVHMSLDAKEWKKEKLKKIGATVVEHKSDYTVACRVARLSADEHKGIYFIDDENSKDLFLGYSAAATTLSGQLKEKNIPVDIDHPLFVYLPCGVGGAPGGITFGLKHIFGDNVHCFFAEPVEAPAMILGLVTGENSSVSVNDIGLTLDTCADGLAVGRPSEFVAGIMTTLLDGCFTLKDNDMLKYLKELYDTEGLKIEPSAAAGFAGPEYLTNSSIGKDYLAKNKIDTKNITHIVWTTGGSMEPEEEFQKNYKIGKFLFE